MITGRSHRDRENMKQTSDKNLTRLGDSVSLSSVAQSRSQFARRVTFEEE